MVTHVYIQHFVTIDVRRYVAHYSWCAVHTKIQSHHMKVCIAHQNFVGVTANWCAIHTTFFRVSGTSSGIVNRGRTQQKFFISVIGSVSVANY